MKRSILIILAGTILLSSCGAADTEAGTSSTETKMSVKAYQSVISYADSSETESNTEDTDKEDSESKDVQLADIILIVRENGHRWNEYDTGHFVTKDGKVFEFDATGLEPDNEYGRFIEYENLYPVLLDISAREEPTITTDPTSMIESITNFSPSEDEWTSEVQGADIGQVDYRIVRIIDEELSFDSIYSHGDEICGYTKNDDAMKIVEEYRDIIR